MKMMVGIANSKISLFFIPFYLLEHNFFKLIIRRLILDYFALANGFAFWKYNFIGLK
jgi:hypothetical protein